MRFATLKTLAAALLLVSASSAFAANYKDNYKGEAPCPAPKMLMGGFYIGAQAGYDNYAVDQSFNNTAPSQFNTTLNANGWVGGLMAGYGMYFNDVYYLGGEVFGNWSGADETTSLSDGVDSVSLKSSAQGNYGLSLLPGIRVNDASTVYVRLGYNWTSLKAQANSSVLGSASKTNTSGGFQYGIGVETLLYQNWSGRAEFNHTSINSFNTLGGAIHVNPSDNQFMVGVLYHFA